MGDDSEYCGSMLILAFDTTAAACAAALWRDGTVLHSARRLMDQGQAEALLPMIESVMAAAKVDYAALDRIAVTTGPGSFTGVRVGLATARGLSLASGKPVVGLTSTETLAAAVPAEDAAGNRILAVIDTKRGDLFAQRFSSNGDAVGDVVALAPGDLATWLGPGRVVVVGDGSHAALLALGAQAALATPDPFPDPAVAARLAAGRLPQPAGPIPLYVHAPAAMVPAARA